MTAEGIIKIFNSPSYIGAASDKSVLNTSMHDFKDHLGHKANFTVNPNGEWIITAGTDGLITVRSIIEPEKSLKIHGHDAALGGVFSCKFSYNYRNLISMGVDGLIRRWDWKYSQGSKKAAAELADAIEKAGLELMDVMNPLDALNEITDSLDSETEEVVFLPKASGVSPLHTLHNDGQDKAKDKLKPHCKEKLNGITEKTLALMKINDEAPELEKIDRSEFVIDLKEKERLEQETERMIAQIRKDQERKNMEKRVLRNRIKKECWDSCEVVGQSIKSFKPNPMLGKYLEITNYPIRKLSPGENRRNGNIKRLRRIQLAVYQSFQKNELVEKPVETTEESPPSRENQQLPVLEKSAGIGETKHSALLYNPFELNTKERRRIQTFILSENIQEIKTNFNKSFKDMLKVKQDEISKIEEKNERIISILTQLQMSEKILKPELDDDELPENIIKVMDSEVKVEKFLTTEELAKLEAKRLLTEERLKLQGDENYSQRALMDMMNGKLEDRKAVEDKEEIVRPEWMNKPREEMSEDEKKLLKEFEKKMAIFKVNYIGYF